VVHIGVDPAATASTTVYPVVLGITGPNATLRNGAGASVTIMLDTTPSALAVPTSAVQSIGGREVVTVLRDGKPVPTVVTTGSVGDEYTAVTSGLSLGQTVVLADLSEPLPASDADTSSLTGFQNGGTAGFRRGSLRSGGGGFGGPAGGG
jgi:multidrug efflux pump subunit AcrA (membrane-fusion protein)